MIAALALVMFGLLWFAFPLTRRESSGANPAGAAATWTLRGLSAKQPA